MSNQPIFSFNNNTEHSGSELTHERFIKIEAMTPGEYKNQGENLEIHYSFGESPFGKMIVASTQKGICSLGLAENDTAAAENLKKKFPKAIYKNRKDVSHQNVFSFFTLNWKVSHPITLHIKSTDFQLKVWKALLNIPFGKLATYGDIAKQTGHPKACRAVGSAVGDNPVFFLIPCHRVILSSGKLGNYYWGTPVKTAIIGWESAKMIQEQKSIYLNKSARFSGR